MPLKGECFLLLAVNLKSLHGSLVENLLVGLAIQEHFLGL
jgi:hypothetical protein